MTLLVLNMMFAWILMFEPCCKKLLRTHQLYQRRGAIHERSKLRRQGKCSFMSTIKQILQYVVCVEKRLRFRESWLNHECSLQRGWNLLQQIGSVLWVFDLRALIAARMDLVATSKLRRWIVMHILNVVFLLFEIESTRCSEYGSCYNELARVWKS